MSIEILKKLNYIIVKITKATYNLCLSSSHPKFNNPSRNVSRFLSSNPLSNQGFISHHQILRILNPNDHYRLQCESQNSHANYCKYVSIISCLSVGHKLTVQIQHHTTINTLPKIPTDLSAYPFVATLCQNLAHQLLHKRVHIPSILRSFNSFK